MRHLLALSGLVAFAFAAQATTYYIDSEKGDDAGSGSRWHPWKTLKAVNAAPLGPGDELLFKRGGLWRGNIRAKSGAEGNPLLYGAYGSGPKPIIENSVSRNNGEDWTQVSPGIWATRPHSVEAKEKLMELQNAGWSSSFQENAKGSLRRVTEQGASFMRVTCEKSGTHSNYIQIWGPCVSNYPASSILRMRVRSSIPFKMLDPLRIMLNHPQWNTFANGFPVKKADSTFDKEWKTVDFLLDGAGHENTPGYLHLSIGGMIPDGAVFDFEAQALYNAPIDRSAFLPRDVGILILNNGASWGVKKWKLEDLKKPLDFWYEQEGQRVFMRYDMNPAAKFSSIEMAFTQHIIEEGGCHDVIFDGLAVRYGAAHGFGGGNTKRITIRNCDIYWIGGGLQYWHKNGFPVRFGNAIEFWGAAEGNLVEHNRIWQVYDAALTNQTAGSPEHETDIIWRDNIICLSEYSFEYWNHDPNGLTANILFEHNTCIDAGFGYAHEQRPDKNGAHLMFYDNAAPTTNFVVRNNIFCGMKDRSTRMWNDWRKGLTLQNNLYYCEPDKIILEMVNMKKVYHPAEFAQYQTELGMDQGSVFAKPQFVNAADMDYRLKPGTIGTTLATDGGPVGARPAKVSKCWLRRLLSL